METRWMHAERVGPGPPTLREIIQQSHSSEKRQHGKRARREQGSLSADRTEQPPSKTRTRASSRTPASEPQPSGPGTGGATGTEGGVFVNDAGQLDMRQSSSLAPQSATRVESAHRHVTSATYSKRAKQPKSWSKHDMSLLYSGLREFGQDFTMIQWAKFPSGSKTRMQIKRKLQQEEREKPLRVREILERTGPSADGFQYQWLHDQIQQGQGPQLEDAPAEERGDTQPQREKSGAMAHASNAERNPGSERAEEERDAPQHAGDQRRLHERGNQQSQRQEHDDERDHGEALPDTEPFGRPGMDDGSDEELWHDGDID